MKKLIYFGLIIAIPVICLPLISFARPRYLAKTEMIEKAEIIAIVEVTRLEPLMVSSEPGIYTQKVNAAVERIYKGNLSHDIILWGIKTSETEIRFTPGRYLVFLKHDKDMLAGVNWHFSARPIRKGKIEWYANTRGHELKDARLEPVLEEITAIIARQRAPEKK